MTTMDDFIRNNDEEVILKGFELEFQRLSYEKAVESPYASAVVQNNCIALSYLVTMKRKGCRVKNRKNSFIQIWDTICKWWK
jgi:hypothetical protein